MMALTATELRRVLAAISDAAASSVVLFAGTSHPAITDDAVRRLQRRGWLPKPLPASAVQNAYVLGRLHTASEAARTARDQPLGAALESVRNFDLSAADQRALAYLQTSAGEYLRGIAQSATGYMTAKMLAAQRITDTAPYLSAVRATLATGMLERQTRAEVARELAEATGDWSRDMRRVAHTELHRAHQTGSAQTMLERAQARGDADVEVSFVVRPDACPKCRGLYLKPNGEKRMFSLSEVVANGTNVGRKAAAWQPVVPPLHPNCTCILEEEF